MTTEYDTKNLWLKWTVLVWLNAIFGLVVNGLFAGFGDWLGDWLYGIGIFFGVWVFVPIYVFLDNYALNYRYERFRKSLWISVIIRAFMQVAMVVDIFAVGVAFMLIGGVMGFDMSSHPKDIGFLGAFFLTVVTGGVLSVVVFILMAIIMMVITGAQYFKERSEILD